MSDEQRESVVDLIFLISLTLLVLCLVCYPPFISLLKDSSFGVSLFSVMVCLQFIAFGLGTVLVVAMREESFTHYGIVKRNTFKSILLTSLVYIPQITLCLTFRKDFVYIPFQYIVNPKYLTLFNLPGRLIAYLLIIVVWELLQVFTYVVINDKINKIFKPKNLFLNPGAISCAVFVVLIHALVGTMRFGWLDAITTFILIYGTLIVREYTQNSIGGILWFVLCWNTFG